jgi:FixJ family two-component response regulator
MLELPVTSTGRVTPVHGDSANLRLDNSSEAPAERQAPLVAVVDDDASFRKAMGRLVRIWGFRTWTFASAEEYLRMGVSTDCIVLDLHLEGMSGLELQCLLLAERKAVPIIFVTAMDDPVARGRALKAGAVAYLEKPFDESRLLQVLESVTGYRQG